MRLLSVLAIAIVSGAETASIEKLSFLAGCWTGADFEEMWTTPKGGSILGVSRTIREGKTVFTEYFHIAAAPDGGIVLNVQLRLAGKSTQFRLTELRGQSATFSNPEHDYPKQITYRREANGSLFARIEGTTSGKSRHDEFKYVRASCGQ